MAGFCDVEQRLCLGLALWNGRDPILKERMFGLTGAAGQPRRGREGVLVVPRRRARATPGTAGATTTRRPRSLRRPVAENGRRGKLDPEYELLDTGVFDDDRYWIVEVDYAKADPTDLLMTVRVTNAGPDAARCTCCPPRGSATPGPGTTTRRSPSCAARRRRAHRRSTTRSSARSSCWPAPDPTAPRRRCCSARTRPTRRASTARDRPPPYPKDGINDHVVGGRDDGQPGRRRHQGARSGTSSRSAPGATVELRLRLRPGRRRAPQADATPLGRRLRRRSWRERRAEADEFYAELTPADGRAPTRRAVMRQAFAGMLWSKQLYYYDVARWLDGDPTQPPPPAVAPDRPQRPLAQLRRRSTSCRCPTSGSTRGSRPGTSAFHCVAPGPRRPGVRQVPAPAAVPRVVPAPQRRAARLRVGLRRRQPARAGLGGARGVRHRRRDATSTS